MSVSHTAGRPFTCFLVATEPSGDRLGAGLMQALRQQIEGPVRFLGVGGAEMEGRGLSSLFPVDGAAIVGVTAVVRALPALLRQMRTAAAAAVAAHPDVLVLIDSPSFTHRVARSVRRAAPAIPIVDYVAPQVWAWRPGRAKTMRAYIDQVMALLPFEPAAYQRLGGPPCTYVGHSLIEEVGELRGDGRDRRRQGEGPPVVLLLPGSRRNEIHRLLGIFGRAAALVAAQAGPLDLVLPTLPHFATDLAAATADWPLRPRIVSDNAGKRAAFRAAHAALAASGTVTLELALAGVPTVAAYRLSPIEYFPARMLIRVPSVILANLVLGESIIPEFLQHDCRADRIAAALAPLLADGPERARQLAAFSRLDRIMEIGSVTPSARAAEIVLVTAGATGRAGNAAVADLQPRVGNHFGAKP
jgi:lipid-A-disaccharide synthase